PRGLGSSSQSAQPNAAQAFSSCFPPMVVIQTTPERATRSIRAFSSEVDAGSREENASKQEDRAPFRFNRNGKGSRDSVWVMPVSQRAYRSASDVSLNFWMRFPVSTSAV